jgi:hypothetical protein
MRKRRSSGITLRHARISVLITNTIVRRYKASQWRYPSQVTWTGHSAAQTKAAVNARVTGKIDRDIDSIGTNQLCNGVVVEVGDLAPVIGKRYQLAGDLIFGTVLLANRSRTGSIVHLEHGLDEQCDGVLPEIGREVADPYSRVITGRERDGRPRRGHLEVGPNFAVGIVNLLRVEIVTRAQGKKERGGSLDGVGFGLQPSSKPWFGVFGAPGFHGDVSHRTQRFSKIRSDRDCAKHQRLGFVQRIPVHQQNAEVNRTYVRGIAVTASRKIDSLQERKVSEARQTERRVREPESGASTSKHRFRFTMVAGSHERPRLKYEAEIQASLIAVSTASTAAWA